MAVIYLRSTDGNDADDGSTWALAKATLAAALTAAGAGGTVYVSDNHAESQASAMTLTSPGTAASPVRVICVDDAGNPEPPTAVATTATVTTTGNSAITLDGFAYVYGITFTSGSGATGAASLNVGGGASCGLWLDTCTLAVATTGTSSRLLLGQSGGTPDDVWTQLNNCTITFASVSQQINPDMRVFIYGGSIGATGSVPTNLFAPPASKHSDVVVIGCDLSAFGSGKNLVFASTTDASMNILFENCKLGASVTLTTGSVTGHGGVLTHFVNCDSGDTNYKYYKQTYPGVIENETVIVRSSGASNGTTPFSRKMVTTANSHFFAPLESDPIPVWNETTGSAITATIEAVTDNVTLTDAEAWIVVEYLGTSGFPKSTFLADRASSILSTPANQTSSSVTWTTTGLGTPIKQKLSVTFTPQEKGPFLVRVFLAKASTTMYFCPKVDVT